MSAIFISHSSRDDAWADEVRRRLEAQGHRSIFLDFDPADGIPAGRDWEQELYHRLRSCRAVLVLCSAHSMASRWCFAEITHAKSMGKAIFPLKIDDCEVDPVLTSRQVLDLTQNADEGWARLWRGLIVAGLDPADAFDWQGDRPPYPGLLSFQEEDAAVFFGRGDEIQAGLETLHRLHQFGGARWLMVLGASGSGKSSLVRAGLLPRLRRDPRRWLVLDTFRPGSDPFWELTRVMASALGERQLSESIYQRLQGASFTPPSSQAAEDEIEGPLSSLDRVLRARGSLEARRYLRLLREAVDHAPQVSPLVEAPSAADDHPLAALARALVAQSAEAHAGQAEARVLVVVDQFEELLTDDRDGASARFLELLRGATDADDGPLQVVATLRSDFFAQFQKTPSLIGLGPATLSVGPMTASGIAQTIVEPARMAGLELETGLVETLVEDARSVGSLPLLAFALRELWERCGDDGHLTVAEYRDRLGGMSGSVAQVADAVLASVEGTSMAERELRAAFLSLSRIDEDGRFARRPAPWDTFPTSLHPLLERFVQARLLVSRGDGEARVLEVAHEALFGSWNRLRDWLDEDREFLLWRKRLQAARRQWVDTAEDDGGLLRGAALTEAEHWLAERPQELATEGAFIAQSVGQRDAEEAAVRRRRSRVLRGVMLAALVCLVAAAVAWRESLHAKRLSTERRAALMVQASSDLLDPVTRTLLLIESATLMPGREPAGGAREARRVAGSAIPRSELYGHDAPIVGLDWSPDGKLVATSSFDQTVRLYSSDGVGIPRTLSGHQGDVLSVMFDAAGTRLVSASADGTVRIWSVGSGGDASDPVVLEPDAGIVHSARFDPTGGRVVAATEAGTVVIYDLAEAGNAAMVLTGHEGPVFKARFSPDGRFVLSVSQDGTARLWNTADSTSRVAVRHDDWVLDGVWSQDGRQFATTSRDRTAAVCRLDDAACERLTGHTGWVWAAEFDASGARLATASADNTARIWTLGGGRPPLVLRGHQDWVRDIAWRPDGRRVLTASHDGSAALWDTDGNGAPAMLEGHKGWVREAIFDPDGRFVATASDDSVRIWRASPPEDPRVLVGHSDQVWSASFSHPGDRIVTTSADLTARIWDAESLDSLRVLKGHEQRVRSAEFSPDDRSVATASDDATARIWPLATDDPPVVLRGHTDKVLDINYSHDGTELATASYDHTIRLWRPDGATVRSFNDHGGWVRDIAYSPDDVQIVSASQDRTVRVRNRDGTGVARVIGLHNNQVMTTVYQKNGTRVISGSADRTARIWAVDDAGGDSNGQPHEIGRFVGHESLVWSADISPDGTRVVTASQDGTARVWRADDPAAPPIFLDGHTGAIWDATFSRDGTVIATASADHTVRLWSLWAKEWDDLIAVLRQKTNACLATNHRQRFLGESPADAQAAYEACEAQYSRLPPVP